MLPWLTGKVIKIQDETNATRRFWIQMPELEKFDFAPGQFVTLDLPIHEQKNKRWRSYSIASWPDGTNVIELVIVLLEGGLGTTYLFNEVTVGSELILRGPQGVFTLPSVIEKDLYFICTGTGIAPFRAMVRHILNNNIPHQNIYLIFGCRKCGDALYKNEMQELEGQLNAFKYLPTYSREEGNDLVRKGYVHAVYEDICTSNKTEADLALRPAHFYLCGWKNMIDEAKQRIIGMGYDKKDIHLELYG
jgi:CDP-4-dehydro-6-deoxyglucose reductase